MEDKKIRSIFAHLASSPAGHSIQTVNMFLAEHGYQIVPSSLLQGTGHSSDSQSEAMRYAIALSAEYDAEVVSEFLSLYLNGDAERIRDSFPDVPDSIFEQSFIIE